jgi:pimeloyl-ACP methyl ester carboxylesterase
VLVGHSYGGTVITEAGNHPKVERLAYITAFAPDKGESVNTFIANPPPGAPVPPNLAAKRWVSVSRQIEICSLVRG